MSCYTKEELENMLEDVVNELDLSGGMIKEHGPLGTSPAKLVRRVLALKNKKIQMLKQGFTPIAPTAPHSNAPAEAEGETPLLDAATELLEVSDLRGDSEMPNPCDDPKLWTSRAQEAWENLRIAVDEKEAEKPAPRPGKPPSLPRGPEICNDFIET